VAPDKPNEFLPLAGKLLAKLKAEYIRTKKSARVLSVEFRVSEDALSRLITKEGWRGLRTKTDEKIAEKLVENLSTETAAEAAVWVTESLRMARELRDELWLKRKAKQVKVMGSMDGPVKTELDFLNDPKDARAFAAAMTDVDKMGRLALRLDAKKDEADGKPGAGSADGDTDALARAILQELEPGDAGE
jgi:hypothetical protein